MTAADVQKALQQYADATNASFAGRFFKTGKGQYGEGDIFIGVRVPQTRLVCKQFKDLPLAEIAKLLDSKVHEERLAAVILLSNQYPTAAEQKRQAIYDLYLEKLHSGRVNNWDIVDSSAEYVVGRHLEKTDRKLLYTLAKSKDLWRRRVAIIATFGYIKRGDPTTTLDIAEILLHDDQDLIHKAVGWMLREAGKKTEQKVLTDFLDKHAHEMPRTMLRYAIEKLDATQKSYYMAAKEGRA
jgi:3-methyladenine DNA glycosylase AlkD